MITHNFTIRLYDVLLSARLPLEVLNLVPLYLERYLVLGTVPVDVPVLGIGTSRSSDTWVWPVPG